MTIAAQPDPSTAMELLFGQAADATEALAREISSVADKNLGRVLEIFPEVTRTAAVREATSAALSTVLVRTDLTYTCRRG